MEGLLSAVFVRQSKKPQQTIDFCAVGAHHQNGIIERHFQTITTKARAILLHAKRHWPTMIAVILWPFAFKYAEMLHNHLHLDNNGLSPAQKFCMTTENINLHDLHTWGCLCYVLDKYLQNSNMLTKWEPRSRLGIYLGHSPCHTGSVALVLNPTTLHISPQFHVAFDDEFTTIPYLTNKEVPPNWKELVQKSEMSSVKDYDLAKLWVESQHESNTHLPDQEGEQMSTSGMTSKRVAWDLEGDKHPELLMQPILPDLNDMTRRKSSRTVKLTSKAQSSNDKVVQRMFGLTTNGCNDMDIKKSPIMLFVTHLENVKTLFDNSINECHFYIYNAVASTNDVYTLKEMLQLKDIFEFVIAMMKEIEDHEERDHWMLFKRADMPKKKGAKTILSVWALKNKATSRWNCNQT